MTLTITKGMEGRKVELVGKYSSKEVGKMQNDFARWKKKADPDKYRVASYDRLLLNEDDRRIIIDFGDYAYFGLVKAASKKEWEVLLGYSSKPIDLKV